MNQSSGPGRLSVKASHRFYVNLGHSNRRVSSVCVELNQPHGTINHIFGTTYHTENLYHKFIHGNRATICVCFFFFRHAYTQSIQIELNS